MVSCFRGAKRLLDMTNAVDGAPSDLTSRRYATAPNAISEASVNTCSSYVTMSSSASCGLYERGISMSSRSCNSDNHASHVSSSAPSRGSSQSYFWVQSCWSRCFARSKCGDTNPIGSNTMATRLSTPRFVAATSVGGSVTFTASMSVSGFQTHPRARSVP